MRKINFLKIVLGVATAMLVNVSVFGQNPPAPYGVYDANLTAPTNIDYVTLKTGGTTMGYYALPDPVYHPNYPATGVLTDDFTWDWTVVSDPGSAPTITPGALDLSNYATILYPVIGHYSLTVAETAPAAMGGCVDATPTELEVEVIAAPTGTASINPGVLWTAITPNEAYQICSAQLAQTVTVAFNEAVPNLLASYAFQVTETKEVLDGLGNVLSTPQAETVVQDFPAAGKLKTGTVGTLPSAAFNAATPAFTFTFLTDALAVLQNAGVDARTRYTYRVTRTGDAAQNGFYSNISQKSDFIAGAIEYYNFTNQTVSFIVNPAPVTGPIYYVPNTFNY
jgi:hypothetical protein